MKLLLVDDSQLFLAGLRNLLEAAEFDVAGVALSAEMALSQARRLRPDVVLMDVQMPGRSGIEATRTLKQQLPSTKVVMMTISENDEHLFESLKAGADGYLLKGAAMEGFVEALRGIEQNHPPLSSSLTGKLMADYVRLAQKQSAAQAASQAANQAWMRLTERQKSILRLAAEGLTNARIAAALSLSERTVKYEFRAIADHLNLRNRAQVLAQASRYLLPTE